MWDVRACRCCLSTEGKLERISEVYKRIYATVSSLKITPGDGFPYYFCVDCHLQIKKTLAFRRKCQRAYFALIEIMALKKQVTYSDIRTVDRKRTNLANPYALCKDKNIGCYSITTPDVTETDNNVDKSGYDLEIRHVPDNSDFKYNIDIKPILTSDGTNPCTEKSDTVTMVRYTPEVTNSTFIITDIKSAEYEEFLRLEEEKRLKNEIDAKYEETTYDEPLSDDLELEKIDLEDVFKDLKEDLKEDASSEDDQWPTLEKLEPIEIAPKRIRKPTRYQGWFSKRYKGEIYINGVKTYVLGREIARAMRDVTVRLLSSGEQRAAFQCAANTEPFKSARFKCGMCLSTYASLEHLVAHIQDHNKNMKGCDVVCPICSDRFASNRALTIHGAERHWYEYTAKHDGRKMYGLSSLIQWHRQRNKPKEKVETLKYCRKVTLTQEQMYETVRQRILECQDRPYKCIVCKLGFYDESECKKHEKSHIKIKESWIQCDICGACHRNRRTLVRHIEKAHMYAYACKECGECFYTKQRVMTHRRYKHFTVCEYCNATLKGKQKYIEHRRVKHADDFRVGKCHCPACGLMLNSEIELIRHQYCRHRYYCINDPSMGPPECRCPICDIQFVDQSSYQQHLLNAGHRDLVKAIDLACWPCRTVFDSVEAKLAHAENCRDNFPRQCSHCPEILQDGNHSKTHYVKCHHGEPSKAKDLRLCEQCGMAVNRCTWFKHKKRHNAANTVQCEHCSARLVNPKMYISHVLFHHTLRPYRCAVCPAEYKFRTHCRDHILKVHAPERPYGCEFCSRRFAHLDYLEEHSLKAHDVSVRKTYMAKHNYLSRKQKEKIFVYPLMKIDASLVRPEMLEKVQLEMCDYMDTNNQPVEDYRDYLIVDNVQAPVLNVKNDFFVQSLAQEVDEAGDQQTIKRKNNMTDEVVKKKKTKKNYDARVFEDDRNIIIGKGLVKKEIRDLKKENFIMKDEKIEISIEDRLAELEGGISEDRFVTREKGICGRSLPKLDEDMKDEETKYKIEESGNVIEGSGDVFEESGDVFEESEYVLEESGDVLEESGDVLEESGDVLEESEYMLEDSRDVLEESGEVIEEKGGVIEESGDVIEESGDVIEEMVDEQYEVIEQDGEQFVMIDGVLYKLESE